MSRGHQVGSSIDDLCRACKLVRRHTVFSTGSAGEVLRVICDYCGSQHNYRRGGPVERSSSPRPAPRTEPLPLVTERERSLPAMSDPTSTGGTADIELLMRRVIREECGLTPVTPAAKWRDGQMILRPGREGVQEKSIPIETFFHKIVMLRNRLRTLEQQVNTSDISDAQKLKIQSYITGCYGSLTSFNVLFADEDDQFRGASKR